MTTPWEVAFAATDDASGPSPKLRPSRLFRFTRTQTAQLLKRRDLPPITVVEVAKHVDPAVIKQIAKRLANKLAERRPKPVGGVFIIFALEGNPRSLPEWDVDLFRPFRKPERVEIARMRDVEARIEALVPKLRVIADNPDPTEDEISAARPSALDHLEEIIAATKDLRESNGRLSAARVAKQFGVTMSQLAGWLGRSRQAVLKTPDAESLQEALGYFERIARLRAALDDPADFRRWLRLANPQLGGKRPVDLIDEGRWQEVADLVDDMLTGSPA